MFCMQELQQWGICFYHYSAFSSITALIMMLVRSSNTISTHFPLAYGVKPCGVMSPILFNNYVDEF